MEGMQFFATKTVLLFELGNNKICFYFLLRVV